MKQDKVIPEASSLLKYLRKGWLSKKRLSPASPVDLIIECDKFIF